MYITLFIFARVALRTRPEHGCKNVFYVFIPVTFLTFFNVFLFCQRFLFLKTFIENSMKNFEKHF